MGKHNTQDEEKKIGSKGAKKRIKRQQPKKRNVIEQVDKPFTMYCTGFTSDSTHGELETFFGAENIDREGYIHLKLTPNKNPYAFITFKSKPIAMDIKQTLLTKTFKGNKLELRHRYFRNKENKNCCLRK